MGNSKKSFVMYKDWDPMLYNLPDEMLGKIMKKVIAFQDGIDIDIEDPTAEAICMMMISVMQKDSEKYDEICEKRAQSGKTGGEAKSSKSKQMLASANQTVANVNDNDNDKDKDNEKEKSVKEKKRTRGELARVLLTDSEYQKLVDEYGADKTESAIKFLDEYIAEKGYKSKSHYLALRRWVYSALDERAAKHNAGPPPKKKGVNDFIQADYDFAALERQLVRN